MNTETIFSTLQNSSIYIAFTQSSIFMALSNDFFTSQTVLFVLSLTLFSFIFTYQKVRTTHRLDVSMYYCYIMCKDALVYFYVLNVLIAIITFLFFDGSTPLYVKDGPGEAKGGMYIPQAVLDGFKGYGGAAYQVAAPVGTGYMIAKVVPLLPSSGTKVAFAGGVVCMHYATNTLIEKWKLEAANKTGSVANKLVSFFSDPTSMPVSEGAKSATDSIDSLLTVTNAGFLTVYAMLIFIILILFNLLRDEILATFQNVWLFKKYPNLLKWTAQGSKWMQVACCVILLYACCWLYSKFSFDLFVLNKIKNLLNNP